MTPDHVESWRSIPSLPGVIASTHGRIWRASHFEPMPYGGTRKYSSRPTFGVITRASGDARHLYFSYHYRGIGNIKVHAAICEAYHGPKPSPEHGVRHKNENGLDNRPENLMWSSQKINLSDAKFRQYHADMAGRRHLPKFEKRFEIYASILDVAEVAFARRHADGRS